MRWSRLWLLVVVLAGALAAALVVVVPSGGQHAVDAELDARLEVADNAATQLLQLHARRWLDAAERLASDAALVEAFNQATRGTSDLALLHQTVLERLRAVNARWKASFVIAVDGRGRVLGRAGADEEQWKDELSAFPVVAEALRGYRVDDTWDAGGRLYRVCAAPVIAGERYAGALVVGDELGAELAAKARGALGVDVLFLLRGRAVGAPPATAREVAAAVAALATERAASLSPEKHSDVVSLVAGEQRYATILSPLAGEAAENGAMYALVAERARVGTSPSLLLDAEVLRRAARPLLAVAGAATLALGLGWLLLALEHGRRLRRLARDLAALERGEIERVVEARHARALRPMARAANALAARASARGAPPPMPLSARVGGAPAREIAVSMDPEAPESAPAIDGRRARRGRKTPVRVVAAPRRSDGEEAAPAPLAAATVSLADVTSTAPPTPLVAAPVASAPLPTATASAPSPPPPPASSPSPSPPVDEAARSDEYRALFREFLSAKQSCGEPVEGVTFEKFLQRLDGSRAQLAARYGCSDVKFHVYVKDGKAALKASPR